MLTALTFYFKEPLTSEIGRKCLALTHILNEIPYISLVFHSNSTTIETIQGGSFAVFPFLLGHKQH